MAAAFLVASHVLYAAATAGAVALAGPAVGWTTATCRPVCSPRRSGAAQRDGQVSSSVGVLGRKPGFCTAQIVRMVAQPIEGETMVGTKVDLLSTSPSEIASLIISELPKLSSETAFSHAQGVWKAIRKGLDPRDANEESELVSPRVRRALNRQSLPLLRGRLASETVSSSATQKILFELHDGHSVECVVIPMGRHTSVCVSSQVGCSRGCRFCSTGTMGLIRSLTASEILSQIWLALRVVRECKLAPLVNVIFMGMGEPVNNLPQVEAAVKLLTDPDAFNFSPRTVVVSTVGPSPASIVAAAARLPCKLAWSVHAADNDLRKLLVPTTAHTVEELRDAFVAGLAMRPNKLSTLLVECTMLSGVNDSPAHADALARLLQPFGRSVLVNLIPYNENGLGIDGELFKAPEMDAVYKFQRAVWAHGLLCTVRATRGDDARSACGQLATSTARETLAHESASA